MAQALPEILFVAALFVAALYLTQCRHRDSYLERRGEPPVWGHVCRTCGQWTALRAETR